MPIDLRQATGNHSVDNVMQQPYIPLKPPDSDATGCCGACQADKVAAADVAGKQRSANLDYREKTLKPPLKSPTHKVTL